MEDSVVCLVMVCSTLTIHWLAYLGVKITIIPHQIANSHGLSLSGGNPLALQISSVWKGMPWAGPSHHKDQFKHIKARISSSDWFHPIDITSSQTMRLANVLAVVAAISASISAMPADADAEVCPLFCLRDSNCKRCPDGNCVSMSSLHPGFNHITHRRDRLSIYASSMTVSRVSTFASVQYGWWHDAWVSTSHLWIGGSTGFLLNKFYCRSSNGDVGIEHSLQNAAFII